MLNLSCHPDLMQHLRGYTSSHACRTGLQAKYAGKDPARRLALWRNLANLKMADNTTMDVHIRDFKGLTQRLSDIGISLSVDIQVMIILDSLPSSYLGYVQAITSRDTNIIFEALEAKLLFEESRLNLESGRPASLALALRTKSFQRPKFAAQSKPSWDQHEKSGSDKNKLHPRADLRPSPST